jgi:peptide/nickel transport system ATP-binding protein
MALINSPDLLIADEPTTALDVTVQAQILELIKSLQEEFHTALIVITHDLGVVAEVADQLAVMYGGRMVEKGAVDEVYYRPEMPYTLGLLSSMPRMDQPRTARLDPIPGQPPSLINLPAGCVFRPRCPYKDEVPDNACLDVRPRMVETVPGHEVRCHLPPERRREIAQERLGVLAARGSGD